MKKIMLNEIFQLIVEADQKLKEAVFSKDNKLINQTKEMLKQARSGAQVIGNNALSEQAGRRLADLEVLEKGKEPLSTRAASEQPPELGDNSIHVLEGATFMLSDQMGDVPESRSKTIVKQLFSDALFSGWGVRTMSRDDKAFNPIILL